MKEIILTTPEQLDEIVQKAIQKVLPKKQESQAKELADTCSVEQALLFLAEQGYQLSKSKLYKLTADKLLPFRYFGRRIIFSRKELLQWVQQQTIASSNSDEVILTLTKDARRKTRNNK